MFSSKASLGELARLCRNVGVSLHSGIGIVKAFELAAKNGSGTLRDALSDVIVELKSGSEVTAALQNHRDVFPGLLVDMVHVGESTGNLPEVFKALSDHYEYNLRLRNDFIRQMAWPVIQLVVAIFIIAALIAALGLIGDVTGITFDILGWGLLGISGALIWLGGWTMLVVSLFLAYKMMAASLAGKSAVHRFLMSIPVVGNAMRSIAIARFSWAFALTQGGGMSIEDSINASLRATSNGAFISAGPQMISDLMAGETLTEAISNSGLFPQDFIEFLMVAEHSGTVPEAMERMSPEFEDQARRSLANLAAMMTWLTWIFVAGLIIFLVFTIALWYIGMINSLLQGVNG